MTTPWCGADIDGCDCDLTMLGEVMAFCECHDDQTLSFDETLTEETE